MPDIADLLRLGDSITFLPIIHGSGQFAVAVRQFMLAHEFDVLAVPLPPSFQEPVEAAVLELPRPGIVIQQPAAAFAPAVGWSPDLDSHADEDSEEDDEPDDRPASTYVPIDPCQGVIAAIRVAMGEHTRRAFIDLETEDFQPFSTVMPDPYALRHVRPETFAAAVLPSIPRPSDDLTQNRMRHMAARLKELQTGGRRVLFVDSVLHWPWIREAFLQHPAAVPIDTDEPGETIAYDIDPKTLVFLLGELPFITSLYERAREELESDDAVPIDGVKELLVAAKDAYLADFGKRARRVTPLLLGKCLQYIRNLALSHRRMTPDLVTIVTACQQILGDPFALHVAEVAGKYASSDPPEGSAVTMGIDQGRLPDGTMLSLVNRLPGPPTVWRTLQLKRKPTHDESEKWKHRWNPYSQCSYPPEDERIEALRNRVSDRAQAILGQDLARTEKFTTSVMDGIDIRDTLRHWYEGSIYVKVQPPARGKLDATVMLFDAPADPRDYPWRTTWFAEHKDESTLAFYGTDYMKEMVGPGIGLSHYGGAMFLYPPVVIRDIWHDRRLDFTETLEERLIAAACQHSRSGHIALLSSLPPGGGFRRLARRFKKTLVHVPLAGFSDAEVQQLRMVHVLNGAEIRSYAAEFIRRA